MALTSTFTTISAGQTDANSPLDTILMDAIRQDIDVLYEWIGGPTYTPSTSHDHDGINSAKVDIVASFLDATTGSYVESYSINSGEFLGDISASYNKLFEFIVPRAGTYSVRSGIREYSAAYNFVIRIYRNGSAVGTEHGGSSGWSWWNEDIIVSSNDLIQLYGARGGSSAERADMAMAIMSGNPFTSCPLYTDIEELNLLGAAGSTAYWVYSS